MINYYVDTINGLDTNNGLSGGQAFKTLQALINGIIPFKEDTTIYLMSGMYTVNNAMAININAGVTVNVIGRAVETILQPTTYWGYNNNPLGTPGSTLNINKLVFDMLHMGKTNAQNLKINLNLNNVAIINIPKPNYSNFFPNGSIFIFKNCIALGSYNAAFRCDKGNAYLYNCYGRFANGYNTVQTKWDIDNNIITTAPQVDDKYQIIDDLIPDSIGLYSGDFNWAAVLLLLKMNNQYYSIKEEYYNIDTKQYNPLASMDFSAAFSIGGLLNDITIGEETFKPMNKFDNFSIVLPVVGANNMASINAIKSKKELVVQSFDVNTTLIEKINSLTASTNIPKTSNIKFIFSGDMGDTWMTIVDGVPEYTDCVIPKKRYQDFTNEDELHFNAAKGTIDEVGFSIDVLSSFDWNSLDLEKLRFAYVFSTDKYINNPSMQRLSINYDEKGFMQEMKDSECDIEVFDHTVKVKSNISNPLIETNIII